MLDIEGPYIVTPISPDDQDLAEHMTTMINKSFAEYRQDFTDALVNELMYGELPDAGS